MGWVHSPKAAPPPHVRLVRLSYASAYAGWSTWSHIRDCAARWRERHLVTLLPRGYLADEVARHCTVNIVREDTPRPQARERSKDLCTLLYTDPVQPFQSRKEMVSILINPISPTATPSSATTDSARTCTPSPTHESDAPILATESNMTTSKDEEPLYTEINIPLPRLPSPPTSAHPTTPPCTKSSTHTRGRSLSAFSPFHSRSSSSQDQRPADEWPRIRPSVLKNRQVATAMDLRHQSKRNRSSTIDALAVVPAVLVLSAELFTPGSGDDKGRGKGRWEDGIR